MDYYLKQYTEEGYKLRIKSVILQDYIVSNNYTLYLHLKYLEGFEADTHAVKGLDFTGNCVLKLEFEKDERIEQQSIISSFHSMISDLEPATLFFKKDYFDICENNGEEETGWFSSFGGFKYKDCTLFSSKLTNHSENNYVYNCFQECASLLNQIQKINITAFRKAIDTYKFNLLDRKLNLCMPESLQETIEFINGYYLSSPDIEKNKKILGDSYDQLILFGTNLIKQLEILSELKKENKF